MQISLIRNEKLRNRIIESKMIVDTLCQIVNELDELNKFQKYIGDPILGEL